MKTVAERMTGFCKNGHDKTIYGRVNSAGWVRCRACINERNRAVTAAKAAARKSVKAQAPRAIAADFEWSAKVAANIPSRDAFRASLGTDILDALRGGTSSEPNATHEMSD